MKTDVTNTEHYFWGEGCEGWRLVNRPDLSVIRERVPPGASEQRHVHERASQFFLILDGTAVMEVEGDDFRLDAGEGIEIAPGKAHKFKNEGTHPVEFLVVSSPNTLGDRTDLE